MFSVLEGYSEVLAAFIPVLSHVLVLSQSKLGHGRLHELELVKRIEFRATKFAQSELKWLVIVLELRLVQVWHKRGISIGLGFPVHQNLGFMLGIEIVLKKGLRKCLLPSLVALFQYTEEAQCGRKSGASSDWQ